MHGIRSAAAIALLLASGLVACSDAPTDASRALLPTAPAVVAASPVILAAGDVADCNDSGDEATALLLDAQPADAVLGLGDLAYEDGTIAQFNNCYNPTWGRHKARTRPAPGNHEYQTAGATGYFTYFGAAAGPGNRGYYSFNSGAWHILSLNSNVAAGAGSAQLAWIRQDLAANRTSCSLAYWHHPVFSSGQHGNNSLMREIWRVLDSAGVDVILVGHDHNYERFAPQSSTGTANANGVREFVVGTGGRSLRPLATTRPNSEVRSSAAHGILRMTLHPTSYEWDFLPVAGRTFTDRGTADCVQLGDGPPPPTNQPPTATLSTPTDGATYTAPASIVLGATASDPEGNVSRVEFLDGAQIIGSDVTSPYSFTWTNVPAGSYTLSARAVDAGNATGTSASVRVTVNAPQPGPNQPPVANPGGPYTANEGVALTLNGAGSRDPNGDALTYAWSFGDGTTSTAQSPSKTYGDNGSYAVTLVVTDPAGASHSASTTATIANVAPTGTFIAPASAASGASYTLAIQNASDVAADRPGLQYQFDCGAGFGAWGSAASTSCPGVTGPATRAVRGSIRDKDNGARTFNANIAVVAPPAPPPSGDAYFLVLDKDAIGKDEAPNRFTEANLNFDLMDYAARRELRWFAANAGRSITLYSGYVGGEGFHAPTTIPASWRAAGPTADGVQNYLRAGAGLGSPNANGDREALLDKVPGVAPLRATGLRMLIGKPVCALVSEGSVGTNYGPLSASLKGKYLGIVAFVVDAVTPRTDGSALPAVRITVHDADVVCAGVLKLLTGAPLPGSSSDPTDVGP